MAKYHVFALSCPQCKKQAEVYEIAFNSDGSIKVHGVCMQCEVDFSVETTVADVFLWTAMYDDYPGIVNGSHADC